jgi:ATP-dependent helicase/nuclease subunit B
MTGLPEYQGEILSAISLESLELLAQLKNRVYSVSQLETYGKCPFQFFANRILRLNTVKDLEEEFSALDKGSVIHDILFEFYTEHRENKFPLLSICSEQEFAQAHQRLLAIAERKLNDIDIPDTFWDLEKELLVGDQHTGRGLLRQYLDFERARSSTFLPSYFEVGFGNELGSQTRIDKTLSSEEPIVAENVMLHGKVDRIEISDDAFAIIDYKTGSNIPKLDDIREGISLQLPIYLYTIEKLLAEKLSKELQPGAGMYYLLRNKIDLKTGVGSLDFKDDLGIKAKTGFLTSDADLRSLINESIKYVNKYVDEISLGRFPLTTHDKIDKVCMYCDYKTTCRIQTVRRVQQAKPEG